MTAPGPPVLLTHGLWMGAWVMRPLARRLSKQGLATTCFSYSSRARSLRHNVAALVAAVRALNVHRVDLVGHSLGGVVIVHALQQLSDLSGRAVLLGSPVAGSHAGERFSRWPGVGHLLGHAAKAVSEPAPAPPGSWSVSMIAGTRRIGLGVLVSDGRRAGDGTVALTETQANWLDEHITVPQTHSSLLVSKQVAAEVVRLLG